MITERSLSPTIRLRSEQVAALFQIVVPGVVAAAAVAIVLVCALIDLGALDQTVGIVWALYIVACAVAHIALRYGYLPLAEVVETLSARRPGLHVVVTGRNAKPELIEAADCVTEFALIKHHFAAGVRAQAGVEF